MARKSPLGRIKDAAVSSLKHPFDTAGKAVGHAKGTVAIGKMVAGQVTRTAAGAAVEGVGVVTGRRGRPTSAPTPPGSAPADEADEAAQSAHLRPVPSVNEPGHPPVAQPAAGSAKQQGDPTAPAPTAPQRKAASKAPAKKAPAKKAPAKKAPAKKAPAKKAVESDAPTAAKAAAKEAPAKRAAESIGEPDPDPAPVPDVTPADVAEVVAKKAPAKKVPAQKAAAKKAPADSPGDTLPPRSASVEDEPLLDPSIAKSVRSESETLQQAADPDKG